MTITAEQVINTFESALEIYFKHSDSDGLLAVSDLLVKYRSQDEPKYHLFQRHIFIYGVAGIESVVADDSGHITHHVRQMERELPAEDGWWANWKNCEVSQLGDEWEPVGDPKTLEELVEWEEKECTD